MRLFFLTLFAVLIAGCATTPIESARPARDAGTFAVATIAPFGSFEFEAAPAYTRLAVARRLAARRLSDGRMTVEHAIAVQAAADDARRALDAAAAAASSGDRAGARDQLGDAMGKVRRAEKLVEQVR